MTFVIIPLSTHLALNERFTYWAVVVAYDCDIEQRGYRVSYILFPLRFLNFLNTRNDERFFAKIVGG